MSTLTITPTTGKNATVAGVVAVRESVDVVLVGLGSRVDEGLVLRVLGSNGTLAVCEQWAAGGTDDKDALGTLDLNTEELIEAMGSHRQRSAHSFGMTLWSLQEQELVLDVVLPVRANHAFDDESAPQPVAKWGTDLTPVMDDLADLSALLGSHAHTGTGSAQVAHGDLTGAGTVTHGAIEAALANLAAGLNVHADRLAALEAWRVQAAASLAAAGDDVAALKQWRDSAIADLSQLAVGYGALAGQVAGLQAIGPADLGWSVGAGTTLRGIAGDSPSYGDFVKAFRTLVADLKGRGVI